MKLITQDGLSLDYQTEGSGRTLLFLHGITDHKKWWSPVISKLTNDFTCVSLDFRGHGASSREGLGPTGLLMDIESIVDHLGVEVGLIGHSLGGFASIQYAASHPDKVFGIVNVDQLLNFSALAAAFRPLEPLLKGPEFPVVLDQIFAGLGVGLLPKEVQDEMRAYRGIDRQQMVLTLWDVLFTASDADLNAISGSMLESIHCPYLALHGNPLPEGYEAWMHGHLPGAKLEVWPGLGHYLHMLEPDRTAERIREFFRSPR
jgi:pimeloyl-ACP methyl ester carboxylesterase